jgi:hypothetical protein
MTFSITTVDESNMQQQQQQQQEKCLRKTQSI